jgi:hypothetical protein
MADNTVTHEELDGKFHDLRTLLKADMAEVRVDLKDRIDGVNDRLDVLNGRTGKSEIEIAVLRDRSERAERSAVLAQQAASASAVSAAAAERDAHLNGRKAGLFGAGAGSAAVGALYAIWQWIQTIKTP